MARVRGKVEWIQNGQWGQVCLFLLHTDWEADRSQVPTQYCGVTPLAGKGRAIPSVPFPGWVATMCLDTEGTLLNSEVLWWEKGFFFWPLGHWESLCFFSRSFLPREWGLSNWVKGIWEGGQSGLQPGSRRESTKDIPSYVILSKSLSLTEPQVDRLFSRRG